MNRITAAALTLLAGIMLAACGKTTGIPYLSSEERTKLETQIRDSISMGTDPTSTQSIVFSIQNNTAYDIQDFAIIRSDNGGQLIGFPTFPAGGKVRCSGSQQEDPETIAEKTGGQYQLLYTIGDYTYKSPYYALTIQGSGDTSIRYPQFQLETASGMVSLDFSKALEFTIGNEIKGLKNSRIYSIDSSLQYNATDDCFSTLNLVISGKGMSAANLICKIYDENGTVLGAESPYQDDSWTMYAFTNFEAESVYTVKFEELGGK